MSSSIVQQVQQWFTLEITPQQLTEKFNTPEKMTKEIESEVQGTTTGRHGVISRVLALDRVNPFHHDEKTDHITLHVQCLVEVWRPERNAMFDGTIIAMSKHAIYVSAGPLEIFVPVMFLPPGSCHHGLGFGRRGSGGAAHRVVYEETFVIPSTEETKDSDRESMQKTKQDAPRTFLLEHITLAGKLDKLPPELKVGMAVSGIIVDSFCDDTHKMVCIGSLGIELQK